MIKLINYFFQSLIIYLIFLVGRLLGIKLSRIIFSKIFCLIGPFFKSKKIIKKNLKIFYENGNSFNEKNLINDMWKNYGMTFIEYIFLHKFKKVLIMFKSKEKKIYYHLIKTNLQYLYQDIWLTSNSWQWKLQKKTLN